MYKANVYNALSHLTPPFAVSRRMAHSQPAEVLVSLLLGLGQYRATRPENGVHNQRATAFTKRTNVASTHTTHPPIHNTASLARSVLTLQGDAMQQQGALCGVALQHAAPMPYVVPQTSFPPAKVAMQLFLPVPVDTNGPAWLALSSELHKIARPIPINLPLLFPKERTLPPPLVQARAPSETPLAQRGWTATRAPPHHVHANPPIMAIKPILIGERQLVRTAPIVDSPSLTCACAVAETRPPHERGVRSVLSPATAGSRRAARGERNLPQEHLPETRLHAMAVPEGAFPLPCAQRCSSALPLTGS